MCNRGGIIRICILIDQVAAADNTYSQEHAEIGPYFGIMPVDIYLHGAPGNEMQCEIHPGQHHEYDRDGIDRLIIEITYAEIMGGETADGYRRETV